MTYYGEGARARRIVLTDNAIASRWEINPVLDGEALMISSTACTPAIATRALALANHRPDTPYCTPGELLGGGLYGTVYGDGTTAYKYFSSRSLEAAGLASFAASVAVHEGLQLVSAQQCKWGEYTIRGAQMHAAIFPTNIASTDTRAVWAMEQVPGDVMSFWEATDEFKSHQRELLAEAVTRATVNQEMSDTRPLELGRRADVHNENYIEDEGTLSRIDLIADWKQDLYVNRKVLGIETYPVP